MAKEIEDLKKLMGEIERSLKILGSANNKFYSDVYEDLKKSADESHKVNENYEKAESLLSNIKKDINDINDELNYTFKTFTNIVNELTKNKNITSEINKSTKSLTNIAGDLVNRQKEIVNLSSKELEKLKEKSAKDFENLKIQKEALDNKKSLSNQEKISLEKINDILDESVGLQDLFNRQLGATIKEQKSIENSLGITGVLLKGITEIPGLKAFSQHFDLKEASISMEKFSKQLIQNVKDSDEFKTAFTKVNTEIQSIEDELINAQNYIGGLEENLKELKGKVNIDTTDSDNEIKRLQSEIKLLEDMKQTNPNDTSDYNKEIANLNKEILEQEEKKAKANTKLLELSNKINSEKQKEKQIQSELNKKVVERSGLEADATEKAIGGLGARFQILGKGLSTSLGGALKLLKDPAFLLTGLFVALAGIDKRIGETAKSLGTSYDEATKLNSRFNDIANASGNVLISTSDIQKSFVELNKQFGTAASFSDDLLKGFTELTQVAGYSNEAAGKLAKITQITGGDIKENTSQILGQAVAFNAANKLALNEKEIVEGVAKASASVTLSLGMQPGKIAQAVMQAKALGLELKEVENIAQSLLNFESSIASELEAELLTGKQLNLERARYYALTNDIEGVAREISEQIGSASDFTNMNVIQQEALAKAVGMTKDQLANTLMEREALLKIGEGEKSAVEAYNRLKKEGLSDDQIAKKLGDDKLAQQLKSQSVQERFAKAIEKLQDIFVTLADPLIPVLDAFANILTPIGLILKGLGSIKGLLPTIIGGTLLWKSATSGILKNIFSIFTQTGRINIAKKLGLITDQQSVATQKTAEVMANRINIAKKLGLITDKQAVVAQKAANMMAKESVVNSKAINFYKNKTLAAAIKTNIQEGIAVSKGKINVALEELRGKSKLRTAAAENAVGRASVLTRLKSLPGLLLDVGKFALKAAGAVAGIPVIGPVLAIAAAGAAIAGGMAIYNRFKGNDILSKGGPGGGYGKRVLSFPEDKLSVDLNDKDTIVAGTNLFNENINPQSKQAITPVTKSPQPDISSLSNKLDALNQTNALLTQILKKDTQVTLDGTKVSKGVALTESALG
jgi:hypothetical protein